MSENLENLKQSTIGKPPCHLRQSMDSVRFLNAADLVSKKEIDDWLPITSSRNAKWWYSAFHNVTAMVGAGVLSLPYAMANLGW